MTSGLYTLEPVIRCDSYEHAQRFEFTVSLFGCLKLNLGYFGVMTHLGGEEAVEALKNEGESHI